MSHPHLISKVLRWIRRIKEMELVTVRKEDRELLWNLFQEYLYEMTNYYDDLPNEQENLHYSYFDAYFSDSERKAFFLYEEKDLVGFALIHPYSEIGGQLDYVLAEFTVFPMYRRNHLATKAISVIFEKYRGKWELKYTEKNTAAKALWTKVTEKYKPHKTKLNDSETVISFCTI
jgi:predicted acetyltransferase